MAVMADANLIEFLQTQSLSPDGDRHPQGSLVIFKAVAGDPGSPSGELHIIEDNEDISVIDPGEESGVWRKIGPAGGDNHGTTNDRYLP